MINRKAKAVSGQRDGVQVGCANGKEKRWRKRTVKAEKMRN
jgi:hypothetical protein